MNTMLRRCAAAVLSIGVAAPVGAADPFAYSFDSCVANGECRLVSQLELGQLRGGFTLNTAGGPLQFTFGISQAVFVNDELVAVTAIVSQMGDTIARLTSGGVPAQTVIAALQSASGAVSSTTFTGTRSAAAAAPQATQAVQPATQAVSGAATPAVQAAAPAGGTAASAVTNATQSIQPSTQNASSATGNAAQNVTQAVTPAAQPPLSASSGAAGTAAPVGQPATQATSIQTASAGQVAAATTSPTAPANAAPSPPPVTINGTPVTPGNPVVNVPTAAELRSLIVQIGTGNSAPVIGNGAVVIQNSVDGAAIRAVTMLEVSAKIKDALSSMQLQNSIRQSLLP